MKIPYKSNKTIIKILMGTPTRYFNSLKYGVSMTQNTRVEFHGLKWNHKNTE